MDQNGSNGDCRDAGPPLIDAQGLFAPGSTDPPPREVAAAVAAAACEWGFFQLVNQ